jgi:hypothetical protein
MNGPPSHRSQHHRDADGHRPADERPTVGTCQLGGGRCQLGGGRLSWGRKTPGRQTLVVHSIKTKDGGCSDNRRPRTAILEKSP